MGEIERRLYEGIPLGELDDISPETLKQIYFRSEILGAAEEMARRKRWTGVLALSPKSS